MIEFKKVTATYRKNIGIFDISFKVNKGELVFLMGPTGAGKSTVLRAIYRDLLIDTGSILLDNEDITNSSNYKIPIIRRKIGMIFQDFKLLNNRTVLENVGMPLRIIGCSKSYMIDKVNSILTKVGLAGLNNAFPYELSGGEQQRVCIARALVKNPKIILQKLCLLLAIPFEEKMLNWKKGARQEDGIWAKYWYKNLHNSTGFLPYTEKEINLKNSNLALSEKCQPYYEFLTNKSITV